MEIGSITKTFTGLLLAVLVVEGTVSLDQPATSLLPLPQLGDVTLLDLATHASGLPRLPRRAMISMFRSPADPYRRYDRERLLAAVPAPRPQPPTYSNLGAALLGAALSSEAGTTYGDLLAAKVLRPLNLSHTTLSEPPAATGHAKGRAVPTWTLNAFEPAGGLRASTDDLLTYARAILRPEETPLAEAIRLATTQHRDFDAANAIGLFWMIGRTSSRRWHNGGTGGAHAWLSIDPARSLAACFATTESDQTDAPGVALISDLIS